MDAHKLFALHQVEAASVRSEQGGQFLHEGAAIIRKRMVFGDFFGRPDDGLESVFESRLFPLPELIFFGQTDALVGTLQHVDQLFGIEGFLHPVIDAVTEQRQRPIPGGIVAQCQDRVGRVRGPHPGHIIPDIVLTIGRIDAMHVRRFGSGMMTRLRQALTALEFPAVLSGDIFQCPTLRLVFIDDESAFGDSALLRGTCIVGCAHWILSTRMECGKREKTVCHPPP